MAHEGDDHSLYDPGNEAKTLMLNWSKRRIFRDVQSGIFLGGAPYFENVENGVPMLQSSEQNFEIIA